MSVLNEMLRNLESRGATADVPALAASARPAAGGFALKPARRSPGRVWIWSATACVVAGVVAGLAWQEQQARAAKERRKPLGWSMYGAAIAQNASVGFGASASTVALADPGSQASGPSPLGAVAFVPAAAASSPVDIAANTASPAGVASSAVAPPIADRHVESGPTTASPSSRPRGARRAASSASAPSASSSTAQPAAEAADAASISITASAAGHRSTAGDLSRAGELIARGRNSEAVPLLAQVLTREPSQAQARAALVALFAENGQRERALALLLDGAQIDAVRFAAPAAQLQAELGDVPGALVTLERVPAARRTAAHHALVGGLAHRGQRFDLAAAAYAHAVAAPDAPGVWWVGLGLAHEALGQNTQARAAFVRASAHPQLPADVRSFVTARLQVVGMDTRREASTVAATAP